MCSHGTLKDVIIVPKPFSVKIDSCIANEIAWLNSQGVYTVNSCCGHGKEKPKAIILANYGSVAKAIELGYAPIPVDMMLWEIELKSNNTDDR